MLELKHEGTVKCRMFAVKPVAPKLRNILAILVRAVADVNGLSGFAPHRAGSVGGVKNMRCGRQCPFRSLR